MVEEGTHQETKKIKKNRTSSVLTREGTFEATSESTVVISSANILLSSSSTSTNELSNKTSEQNNGQERDHANFFENIISNHRDDPNDNSNLDDEKFDKIETPSTSETTNNSFDFQMNISSKNLNNSGNDEHVKCLNELIDNIILPLETLNTTQSNIDMHSEISCPGMYFVKRF